MKFQNLSCYFSAILLNCKFVSVPGGCVGINNNYAQSFYAKNHAGHSIVCDTVVMKIAHWTTLNSDFWCHQAWWLRRHSVNVPTSAQARRGSLSRRVRNIRKRGRDGWQRSWLFPSSKETVCIKKTGWSHWYVVRAKEKLQADRGKMYQDRLTKFCVLRPIKSKRPTEVVAPILDLFLFHGAPAILQSDNGTELTAHVN